MANVLDTNNITPKVETSVSYMKDEKDLKSRTIEDNNATLTMDGDIKGLNNLINLRTLDLSANRIIEMKGLDNLPSRIVFYDWTVEDGMRRCKTTVINQINPSEFPILSSLMISCSEFMLTTLEHIKKIEEDLSILLPERKNKIKTYLKKIEEDLSILLSERKNKIKTYPIIELKEIS